MKVILYARVSTADQCDGISLEAQQAKMEAYAVLYDLEVVETIVDAGESAKSLNRAGLQRALELLRVGKADGCVVVKLDRLTRSVADWQTLIDDYFGEKAGKQLLSVNDSIDTRMASPPVGTTRALGQKKSKRNFVPPVNAAGGIFVFVSFGT